MDRLTGNCPPPSLPPSPVRGLSNTIIHRAGRKYYPSSIISSVLTVCTCLSLLDLPDVQVTFLGELEMLVDLTWPDLAGLSTKTKWSGANHHLTDRFKCVLTFTVSVAMLPEELYQITIVLLMYLWNFTSRLIKSTEHKTIKDRKLNYYINLDRICKQLKKDVAIIIFYI